MVVSELESAVVRLSSEGVRAAVDVLDGVDLSTCGHGALDALAGAVQRVRGYAAAWDVAIARRRSELEAATSGVLADALDAAATSGEWNPSPAPAPSNLDGTPLDLSGIGGRDRRPGRDTAQDRDRAAVCTLLPTFEAALAAGRIDTGHLDAVAAGWRDLDEVERVELARHETSLMGYATVESVERFRRRVRDLARRIARDHGRRVAERQRAAQCVRRWIDRATGMGHLHAELDPETTARVWAALDEHLATVKDRPDTAGTALGRLEVDALVELVTTSTRLDPRHPELVVIVDHATLVTGVFGPGAICETANGQALPPDTVRRLACDAGILPVVLDGAGVPLDAGRTRRLATRDQRRALAAMYATCGMPGCDVRFERCRIHHLDPWTPTGPTDLENLIPCCDRHHHQIHEGGWQLSMTPDRVVTLRAPDGTIRYHGDTRTRHGADDADIWHLTDPDHADDLAERDPHRLACIEAHIRARAITLRCRHRTPRRDHAEGAGHVGVAAANAP